VIRRTRHAVGATAAVALLAGLSACGGGNSEPSGDQAAAADLYIKLYTPSNPDCVIEEHKKLDNENATLFLQAYQAYEVYDYAAEDAAYDAIDDAVEQELTVALNKCAMG
jgi:hypothetical protein